MNTFRTTTKKRGKAGFSLVELLIVVAVVGVLALVGIPAFQGYIENSKIDTDKANEQSALALANTEYSLHYQDKNYFTAPSDVENAGKNSGRGYYMRVENGQGELIPIGNRAYLDTDYIFSTNDSNGFINGIASSQKGYIADAFIDKNKLGIPYGQCQNHCDEKLTDYKGTNFIILWIKQDGTKIVGWHPNNGWDLNAVDLQNWIDINAGNSTVFEWSAPAWEDLEVTDLAPTDLSRNMDTTFHYTDYVDAWGCNYNKYEYAVWACYSGEEKTKGDVLNNKVYYVPDLPAGGRIDKSRWNFGLYNNGSFNTTITPADSEGPFAIVCFDQNGTWLGAKKMEVLPGVTPSDSSRDLSTTFAFTDTIADIPDKSFADVLDYYNYEIKKIPTTDKVWKIKDTSEEGKLYKASYIAFGKDAAGNVQLQGAVSRKKDVTDQKRSSAILVTPHYLKPE